ncbi:MAG: hypothetical protein ACREGR_00365 [Minisyncoccia bacterium]
MELKVMVPRPLSKPGPVSHLGVVLWPKYEHGWDVGHQKELALSLFIDPMRAAAVFVTWHAGVVPAWGIVEDKMGEVR